MADITCPVCGTVNPANRTFCLKCAADLHAMAPDPAAPPPAPKVVVPMQPLLIGGGIALAAIALIALLVVALGGTPAATAAPSGNATLAPTVAASADAGGGSGGLPTFTAPTAVAPTAVAPTEPPPPTAAPPATPKITPVPAPTILSFTGPDAVDCSQPGYDGFITLTWTVDNADSTTLSIDGSGLYKSYPGTQGSDSVPFSCGNGFHTYTLMTVGGSGKPASKTLTIEERSGV